MHLRNYLIVLCFIFFYRCMKRFDFFVQQQISLSLSLSLRTMTFFFFFFFFLIFWFFVLMIQFQGAEVVRMYKTLLGSQGFRKVRFRICLSLNLIMWYKCLVNYIAADLWVSMYTISPLSGHGSLFQETWWASCNLWRFFCCHARCKWCCFC